MKLWLEGHSTYGQTTFWKLYKSTHNCDTSHNLAVARCTRWIKIRFWTKLMYFLNPFFNIFLPPDIVCSLTWWQRPNIRHYSTTQHLSGTVQTKHYQLHKGCVYCRAFSLDLHDSEQLFVILCSPPAETPYLTIVKSHKHSNIFKLPFEEGGNGKRDSESAEKLQIATSH